MFWYLYRFQCSPCDISESSGGKLAHDLFQGRGERRSEKEKNGWVHGRFVRNFLMTTMSQGRPGTAHPQSTVDVSLIRAKQLGWRKHVAMD